MEELKTGKLIAGRWRVTAEIESHTGKSYRVVDFDGRDGELIILDEVGNLQEEVISLREMKDHDNIIRPFEVGSWAGINYLVRELVTGQTVADWVWRENRLEYDQALGIACQLCLASSEMAKFGVNFLGYSPDYILVTQQGFVKIDPLLLHKDKLKKDYHSPEEAQGNTPDQLCDVFRIGLIIHLMLSGKLPKKDSEGSLLPLELNSKERGIPPELDRVLASTVSVERDLRPGDTEELLDVLHPMLMRKPLPAKSSAGEESDSEWYEDKRFWLYTSIGLIALASFIYFILGFFNSPPTQ